ncbi:hypothetical protein ABZT17_00390 [Streptomyces sp. NPDC005648]|uniref:hypothetical protein n=1 Tax=Streptomyces sp. NPDC005648 TaxID=3157044 RepID=UPI0033B03155
MRRARSGLAARAAAATLALLAFGSGQAFAAPAGKPAPPPYTALDLGTLGGSSSTAIAVDRDTVVGGSSTAGDTEFHAYAYDRSTRVMTDLGTLGGTTSSTVGVEGRHVIGDSLTAAGDERAFVYDLRTHHMRELGLGGSDSHVNAISGNIVVGSGWTAGNQGNHAFAYDARTKVMTDLGSPIGPSGGSGAAGISGGRYVVGTWTGPGAQNGQAYVYDLRTKTWTDLSAHGGVSSRATSVSGHTVVGITQPRPGDAPHGFAYDIRTGAWTDLGTDMSYQPYVTGHTVLAGNRPAAYALDLTTGAVTKFGTASSRTGINGVAGKYVAGDLYLGPFPYVYRVDTHRFTQLPSLGGVYSTASAVDRHGAVVGTSGTAPSSPGGPDATYHATLWTR